MSGRGASVRVVMGTSPDVTVENTGVALARQAAEAVRALDDHGRSLRPDGVDRFTWSADVLDELARLAEMIGQAAERVSGEPSSAVESRAQALSTAIVAHRNSLLRPTADRDHLPGGDDRVSAPVIA